MNEAKHTRANLYSPLGIARCLIINDTPNSSIFSIFLSRIELLVVFPISHCCKMLLALPTRRC